MKYLSGIVDLNTVFLPFALTTKLILLCSPQSAMKTVIARTAVSAHRRGNVIARVASRDHDAKMVRAVD